MKYLLLIFLLNSLVSSQESADEKLLIEIKDTSGLSEWEVRDIADRADKKTKNVSLKDVYEFTDSNGSVNIQKLQASWENQTPVSNGYDWIKTKSGEWFKGEIKAMYDDKLEFDSAEIGLYTFDFDDVVYIKSYHPLNVNIEKVASVSGILRFDKDELKIIQGDTEYKFPRFKIVSFAPAGELERNFWSGKVSFSVDVRAGNKKQFDYTARANLKRRTDATRLSLDYLGRVSSVDDYETARDHRITETYDVYISRKFFWTPLFSEYYTDKFQNIDTQLTASVGLGYSFIDTKKLKLGASGGPGIVYTKYDTVEVGNNISTQSPSFETRTKLEWEINKKNDLMYDYKFTFTDDDSGFYKHHMILSLENELTSWLDLDISMIWDHISKPTKLEDETIPLQDDYQLLFGLGIEF